MGKGDEGIHHPFLDLHFSLGTYLPMKRTKHKIKECRTKQKIYLSFKKYKWGLGGKNLFFKKKR